MGARRGGTYYLWSPSALLHGAGHPISSPTTKEATCPTVGRFCLWSYRSW